MIHFSSLSSWVPIFANGSVKRWLPMKSSGTIRLGFMGLVSYTVTESLKLHTIIEASSFQYREITRSSFLLSNLLTSLAIVYLFPCSKVSLFSGSKKKSFMALPVNAGDEIATIKKAVVNFLIKFSCIG